MEAPPSSSKLFFVFFFLCLVAASLARQAAAQSCTSFAVSAAARNRNYALCNSLSSLSSSLHWTYHRSNATVDVAYRAPQSADGWVAWGINPTGSGMVGTQALVAIQNATTGTMGAYATPVSSLSPSMRPGTLSFSVSDLSADYSNGVITISATLQLPGNRTRVSHTWQASTAVSSGFPAGHPTSGANIASRGTIDFLSGESASAGNSVTRRRNTHGVLNAVSWGVLMPVGAIIARYMRVFKSADPAWFYLHVACQCSAYVVGVAGWGTGLKLGSDSAGVTHRFHRNVGIALFCLATLQVFALMLRPNKDHKYRIFWNVYHHSVGYCVIILSIVNIFEGFEILEPAKKWKRAYVGVLIALGAVALVLEPLTWAIVLKRRSSEKSHHGTANGYGGRQHQGV